MGVNSGRATRKDVAARAGVSETIVSYVVNDNRYVDAEKRKRVEVAIKELGYRPNVIARSLKGKSSYHILFIADKIDNEHFGKLVREMDEHAYDKGYLISLCANRNDKEFISNIMSRQVDGLIINSISFSEEYIQELVDAKLPIVLFENKVYKNKYDGVCRLYSGLYTGAKNNVKLLYERGRKNIIYIDRISSRDNFSDLSDLRLKGYHDGLIECGLKFDERNIISGAQSFDEVEEKVVERLKKGGVDAIFGRNDTMALVAMEAAQNFGCKVPKDVMVVGFDNSTVSRFSTPKLSTMEIDRTGLAEEAVKMLVAMLSGEKPYSKSFETKFIERETTKAVVV